jgi:hypothetical protein
VTDKLLISVQRKGCNGWLTRLIRNTPPLFFSFVIVAESARTPLTAARDDLLLARPTILVRPVIRAKRPALHLHLHLWNAPITVLCPLLQVLSTGLHFLKRHRPSGLETSTRFLLHWNQQQPIASCCPTVRLFDAAEQYAAATIHLSTAADHPLLPTVQ